MSCPLYETIILTVVGIFFGFLCNLLVVIYVENPFQSWRILTNTTLIPTIPLLVMIYLMPESPRYLMKHGRYEKALNAFNQVQTTPLLAARDLMYAHAQLDFESRMLKIRANEFRNLADRIDISTQGISIEPSSQLSVNQSAPHTSISPQQPGDDNHFDPELSNLALTYHRGSHHGSSEQGQIDRERGFELTDLGRRESDVSGFDIDLAIQTTIQMARKKENPYSYHIGVTGYYKRLRQLWSNMRCRRALLASSVAMISQQMTGVNTIAFLGTIVCKSLKKCCCYSC
jgi:hypothetical protein